MPPRSSTRGRPPLVNDDAILDAALSAFARDGYEGTSVRALNTQLGLSHETITQRFGNKAELYRAAVNRGLALFMAEFKSEIAATQPNDDLALLAATVRSFVIATSHHPALGELLHHPDIDADARGVLMTEVGLIDHLIETSALLNRLQAAGRIHPITLRELWFLAQGGSAPIHHRALSTMFDPIDGPLDPERHIERTVHFLMRGICIEPV